MPLGFDCKLVCDACGSEQVATASLEAPAMVLMGMSLLTSPTSPFKVSYDRASGMVWTLHSGKAACSEACKKALFEPSETPPAKP